MKKTYQILVIIGQSGDFITFSNGVELDRFSKKLNYFSYEELKNNFPENFLPDIIVFFTPEYHFVPIGVEKFECFLVACVSDWNVNFIHLLDTLKAFDLIIIDIKGIKTLKEHGFNNTAYFPIFSMYFNELKDKNLEKEFDVVFIGNVNHDIQTTRAKYLYEIGKLALWYNVMINYGLYGDEYINTIAKSKISFNKSIRSEANIRVFEALHANSLLFIEDENLEINLLLPKNNSYITFNHDDLNEKIEYYLNNPEEMKKITENGNTFMVDKDKNYFKTLFSSELINLYEKRSLNFKESRKINQLDKVSKTQIIFNNVFLAVEEGQTRVLSYCNIEDLNKNNIQRYNTYITYKYLNQRNSLNIDMFIIEIENKISLFPKYLPLKLNLVHIYIEEKQKEKAISFLQKIIKDIELESKLNLEDLKGSIINEKFSRFFIELEREFSEKTYQGKFFLWKCYELLGDIFYNSQKLMKALKYYEKALSIFTDSKILGKKGKILYILGELKEAYEDYSKAFELDIFNLDNFNNLVDFEEKTRYKFSDLAEKEWLGIVEGLPLQKKYCLKYPMYKVQSLAYKKLAFEYEPNLYLANKILAEDPTYQEAISYKESL